MNPHRSDLRAALVLGSAGSLVLVAALSGLYAALLDPAVWPVPIAAAVALVLMTGITQPGSRLSIWKL